MIPAHLRSRLRQFARALEMPADWIPGDDLDWVFDGDVNDWLDGDGSIMPEPRVRMAMDHRFRPREPLPGVGTIVNKWDAQRWTAALLDPPEFRLA